MEEAFDFGFEGFQMYGMNHALAFDGNSRENLFDYQMIIDGN